MITDAIYKEYKKNFFLTDKKNNIILAELGNDAGIIGASALVSEEEKLDILYDKVEKPRISGTRPVNLTRETMEEHYRNVLAGMKEQNLDVLMIYADREHGANFAYLTGFEPRFEEAVLVLHADGRVYFLLGNENLKMSQYSFIQGTVLHTPYFSLPYQPMNPQNRIHHPPECEGV